MKKTFSKYWIESKQPRKQRKYLAKAPLHIKHKFLSANLSKELRKKYNRRSFPLRKGDVVRIMRGKFKKKQGKIAGLNLKRTKASIEGMQKTKKDGTKVNIFFHPSKLQIHELNLEDAKRIKSIERKIKMQEKSLLRKKALEEAKKEETEKMEEKKIKGK